MGTLSRPDLFITSRHPIGASSHPCKAGRARVPILQNRSLASSYQAGGVGREAGGTIDSDSKAVN